jgi:hypothetical protein
VEAAHGDSSWKQLWATRGGSGGRLSSPAPASGRPASHKDPIAFVIFVLDLIAFYSLFWFMIAFLFYFQGPINKNFDSQVR